MEKIKVIFDTDMGMDCDDTGALSILHNLANEGLAEILAVTHCGSEISGAVCLKAINAWYNREDIPVGKYTRKAFLEEEDCKRYTAPIMEKYLLENELPQFDDAVSVLRKTISENENVTLVVVGMLNNIADLLASEGDEISPLSGVELIKKNVECMYVMGGNFKDAEYCEYNIKSDVPSAKYVADNFPKKIIYCGFELGETVITGQNMEFADDDNPVKTAYYTGSTRYIRKEKPIRPSWDPITAYCSVKRSGKLFKESEPCGVNFDESGRTVISEGVKDCYIIACVSDDEIKDELNKYIV